MEFGKIPKINVAFLDIDGVYADFIGGALELHESRLKKEDITKWDCEEMIAGSTWDFYDKIKKAGDSFWENLPFEFIGGVVGRILSELNPSWVAFLTSRDVPLEAVTKRWLKRKVGDYPVIFSKHKHEFAREDALLFDDRLQTCIEFVNAGGHAAIIPQPWNGFKKIAYIG